MRGTVLAVAALTLLLTACSSSGSGNRTPTPGQTASSVASPAPASTGTHASSPTIEPVTGSPSPQSTTAAGNGCRPSDLNGTAVVQGAEGTIGGTVRLTNTSAASCDISALALELRDSAASSIASSDAAAAPANLVVAPATTAFVTFVWRNYCGQDLVPPLSVVVSSAAGTDIVVPVSAPSGAVPVPRCDTPGGASTLSLSDARVGPVVP